MSFMLSAHHQIQHQRRFTTSLIISVVIHAVIIFGVGFVANDAASISPTLDVIFSQTQTALTPKEADFLAQANQQGGGDQDKAMRPREDQLGLVMDAAPGDAPLPMEQQTAAESPQPDPRLLTSRRGEDPVPLSQPDEEAVPPEEVVPDNQKEQQKAEMARLASEINFRREAYSRRPVSKYILASTKEYVYANYLRSWVERVERIGNLNYPDEARRQRLSGQVIITVGIRNDGRVENSKITSSSGYAVLDQAALQIINLSQPFPRPPKTAENIDVLYITRTWVFLPDGQLRDEY